MVLSRQQQLAWRYAFAIIVLLAGALLSSLGVGQAFLGFSSVGAWLLYIGCVMLAIITLQYIIKKKRVVDERMEFVAARASRITFVAIILFAFAVIVMDGIKPITVSYAYFMSYFISGIVLVYVLSYKVLLKRY